MKFSKAGDVREVVEDMREQDLPRSQNRARINSVFNGDPPMDQAEALQLHAETNVNFLEATNIAHRARSTWNNAMLTPSYYCNVTVDRGPTWKRGTYGTAITKNLGRRMKRSRRYVETIRATGAQVVLHGVGPTWWCRPRYWCPEEVGIEDLLVPDGTRTNLENLTYFTVYQQFTPGQLYRLTHGKKVDPGWNMTVVNKELKRAASELNRRGYNDRQLENPEKLQEFYKANSGITDTSSVPTIDCWSFFFQDEEDEEGRWFKKIIVDVPSPDSKEDSFLYHPKRPYAGALSEILHIQFGDGANAAPFLYHSVRAIGFLLYALCHLQNRLRGRFMDAIFEATLQYFRNVGEGDRAALNKVELTHMGLIPEGLQLVTQAERWQVNEALVGAGLATNRQLMSENASTFVQDVDTGTAKEQTATEVVAKLNQANSLVSSILSMAYTYQKYQHEEIARRFCLKDSPDPDVRAFRDDCIRDGVPEDYLNTECWNVEPERIMGGGNKTLEVAQAKSLMEIKPQFDPPGQRLVTRKYVLAVTDDPDLALTLVPESKPVISTAGYEGQLAFGALMDGGEVAVRTGLDHVSYVEGLMGSVISLVEDLEVLQKQGELPSAQQIGGLINCVKHLSGHIQIIGQDQANGERVKQYSDVISNVMNRIKGYAQRMDEEREAAQEDQVEAAKIKTLLLEAQTKAQIAQAEFARNGQMAQLEFQSEERRKLAETTNAIELERRQTQAEIAALDAKTRAGIEALDAKTTAAIEATRTKAAASAKAAATKAKAKPKAKPAK